MLSLVKRRSALIAAKSSPLGPAEWLLASRGALIAGGIGRVRIAPLAIQLGVTTGSFYWHFKNLDALHVELIADWETTNTQPFFQAVQSHEQDGDAQFSALIDVWLEEERYSPAWDSAMRDWARNSSKAELAVRRVDEARVDLLRGVFERIGFSGTRALVRARITYFHQVGYYALRMTEKRSDRVRMRPFYSEVLRGSATKTR